MTSSSDEQLLKAPLPIFTTPSGISSDMNPRSLKQSAASAKAAKNRLAAVITFSEQFLCSVHI